MRGVFGELTLGCGGGAERRKSPLNLTFKMNLECCLVGENNKNLRRSSLVATSLLTGDFSLDAEFQGDKPGKEALLLGMLN